MQTLFVCNGIVRVLESGVIYGGMIPKVECCVEAIRMGVKKVFIIDGRIPHSIPPLSDNKGRLDNFLFPNLALRFFLTSKFYCRICNF